MTETIKCPNGHRIRNNPSKHTNRDKYCPVCRVVIQKQQGFHISFDWIKEKLRKREEKQELKVIKIRGRVRHNLRLQLGREPTNAEVEKEVVKELNPKMF